MSFNVNVQSGSSVRLPTAGKYCDRDIVVTALGGGGGASDPVIEPLNVTKNGTYTPPSGVDGYSPVIVNVSAGGVSDGLPSGISALASGTVTPTEDKSSTLEITHNLGAVPDFLVWWDTADYSASTGTSMAYLGAVFEKDVKGSASGATVYNHHFSVHGFNASGGSGQTGSRAVNAARMTDTTATLVCNTTYPIKAGHTYRWVCGVVE